MYLLEFPHMHKITVKIKFYFTLINLLDRIRGNQAKILICSDPLFIGVDHGPNHSMPILHHRT